MLFFPLFKGSAKRDPNVPEWRRTLLVLMIAILIISMLPFIYNGTFSRYQADDYCFSSSLIKNGFLGSIQENYSGWSNRFSTVIVIGLIDPLRVTGMQILPGALIVGMLAGLYLLLTQLRKNFRWTIGRAELFILAELVTFFTIYAAPDQFQSFYWRSGSVTYTLPVVILPLLLALLVSLDRDQLSKGRLAGFSGIIFLLSLFSGGFSETTAAFQAAFFMMLLGFVYFRSPVEKRNQRGFLLICALAGIVVAMVIMILSPGNAVRLKNMPETPGLFKLIYLSFRFAAGFVFDTIQTVPIPVIISFLFAFFLASLGNWKDMKISSWKWLFWGIPAGAFLLVVAICAPSAYGESAYAEARAFLPARWILTLGGIAWFYMLGIVFQNWRQEKPKFLLKKSQSTAAFIILLLCFYPVRGAMSTLVSSVDAKTRAQAWDVRAAEIARVKAAGQQIVEVNALDSYGRIRELSDDPKLWVNKCAAMFYGVQQIIAK